MNIIIVILACIYISSLHLPAHSGQVFYPFLGNIDTSIKDERVAAASRLQKLIISLKEELEITNPSKKIMNAMQSREDYITKHYLSDNKRYAQEIIKLVQDRDANSILVYHQYNRALDISKCLNENYQMLSNIGEIKCVTDVSASIIGLSMIYSRAGYCDRNFERYVVYSNAFYEISKGMIDGIIGATNKGISCTHDKFKLYLGGCQN